MVETSRVLAFDVGLHFIRYSLFEDGKQGLPGTIPTPVDSTESFYRALADVVKSQDGPIDGVAVSFPGFVDTARQRAVTAGPLPLLYRHAIGDELNNYLDEPLPVWLENDANCAAIAEKRSGNAKKLQDFVLIAIDTGIGGAMFVDGRIHRGRDWRAGEFGMMMINYDTGGFSNLHDYASMSKLKQMYADEFDVPEESVVPSSLFRRLDEPDVRAVVERWADYLAVGIFNIVAATDPECVLLGGAISREVTLLPLVREALGRIPNWKDFRTPVKRCRHSGNAGLIGAYHAFMDEVTNANEA
ncbi:ROK family protein [Bifidobacterium eulemuris]|uniref:ROK family protein n=1 Tax=Bifidobacterium eulemuris TaxID=1765219 RepID=A0A261GDD9_9BIFI|nr:ROK family protein [Bifidobacterium eulemuris]OZG69461.1 transcriptional regulator [Bifidobacterium eulemuris]QOL32176.1 ROK family protein [Bifidobacterium eulemuris]